MNLAALTFVAVSFFIGPDKITVFVANDYIKRDSIDYVWWSGSDVDRFINHELKGFGKAFTYPPIRVVDEVWKQATCKLKPQPINPDVPTIAITHGSMIQQQIKEKCKDLRLIAGHKKDVVSTNNAGRTAIYGWHRLNGKVIQPYSIAHGSNYRDYSHGFRPMLTTILWNGQPTNYVLLYDK